MFLLLDSIFFLYGTMFCFQLLTNDPDWFPPQLVRMETFHKIFATRIWIFSFFQQKSHLSSQYKAFEEIIQLHHPPFALSYKPDTKQLTEFRSSAKEIFTGLYPKRNIHTCKITPIQFEYSGRQALSYSIRDNNVYDWNNSNEKFILYIHGGLVYGDIEIYSGYECYLSREYHLPVIHIEYRLAPEHNLFAAIEDVVTVYMSMLITNPKIYQRIIGMGDGSGGLLWLRLIQMLVQAKQSVPLALVLFSPWVDITFEYVEFDRVTLQKRILFSLRLIINIRRQAFNPSHPDPESDQYREFMALINRTNPETQSFEGFPPLYVTVGTEELLLTDAYILQRKILKANGQIILEKGYGLMNTYPMFPLWFPEAQYSQKNIQKFIKQF